MFMHSILYKVYMISLTTLENRILYMYAIPSSYYIAIRDIIVNPVYVYKIIFSIILGFPILCLLIPSYMI